MKKDRTESLREILNQKKPILTSVTHEKFDFNFFQIFTEIYKQSSISKAAQALDLPISNVSHNLSKLREYFQDPLFIRQGSHFTPTKEAHNIYDLIEDNLGKMRAELRRITQRSSLVIYASPYFSVRLLPSLSKFIWSVCSDCEIFHKSLYEENQYNDPLLGDVMPDITFEFSVSPSKSMISVPILTEEMCFVCAEHHPRIKSSLAVCNFDKEVFVNFHKKRSAFMSNRAESFPFDSSTPLMNSDSLFALLSIISTSEEIGVIPRWLFDTFKDSFPLKIIQTHITLSPLTIYLIHPRQTTKNPILEKIIKQWASQCDSIR